MGPVPAGVDLSSLTVVNFAIDVAAASPNFTAYLNNSLLFSNTLGGSYPSFGGSLSVVFLGIDGGLTGGGRYLDGKIKHCAFFSGPLTPSQRRSWFDFMRGALTDPPLP
jgi:hypothetical protein